MLVVRDDRKILVLLLVVAAMTLPKTPSLCWALGWLGTPFTSPTTLRVTSSARWAPDVYLAHGAKAKVAVHTKGDSSSRPAGRLDRDVLTSTVDVAEHRRRVQRGTMGAGSGRQRKPCSVSWPEGSERYR